MGHRFSKTAANNIAAAKTSTWKTTNNNNNNNTSEQLQAFHTTTNIIPIPNGRQQQQGAQFIGPTINLQIQESPNITDTTGAHCIGATTSINSLTATAAAAASGSLLQIPQQQHQQYNTNSISSSSLTSVNNLSCGGRQIIIKIQLAKMENGNESTTTATTTTTTAMAAASSSPSVQYLKDTSLENLTADCNLNSTESSSSTAATTAGTQVLNLTLNSGNSSCNSNTITARTIPATAGLTSLFPSTSTTTSSSSSASSSSVATSSLYRTAGSSLNTNNNNNYFNTNTMGNNNNNSSISSCNVITTTSRFERPERLNSSLRFNDEIVEQNIGEIVEYCEVLEQQQLPTTSSCNNTQMLTINEETDNNEPNACCRRKSKSLAANAANGSSTAGSSTNSSSSSNTGTKAKSRCRKCSCRDAFRRFLDPSLSRSPSSNKAAKQQQQKEQKRNKSQDRHSINNNNSNNNNNTTTISNSLMNNNSMHSNNTNITARSTTATTAIVMPSVATNQVSLWTSATGTPHGNDVIIPITTPTPSQIVVVQCAIVNASNSLPPTPNTIMSASSTSSNIPTNGLISIAHDISPTASSSSTINNEFKLCPNNSTLLNGSQTTVHSQVDYVHYLVPDLERITNSSFYWGKMDRYEAERLLEGKPEGTFLLRDSAQEEFLFSVTFRKYGRSLHARIEQSGHRFSFDCHDPCVFTAPTVTGLLEHYKDPACVMFFEPMLTIPLHRKNCFSLQKLCRATIVSNTTYDGINELELPARLKAYLKEYHYKQKLRVKFNEPSYTIHCK